MDVDIVIAWVDGADPAWQAEKARFSGSEEEDSGRYRELGMLKYWFRAVARNAPWVRRIHFLTWAHVPRWLDREHPKIRIHRHGDFIPAEFLPTFSSHTIELNLHRIPGLAERFVYFNDDMYLLRPTVPGDFFSGNLPCLSGREEPWVFRDPGGQWSHAAANGLALVNRNFPRKNAHLLRRLGSGRWQDRLRTLALGILYPGGFTGFPNVHGPSAFCRERFREIWEAEGEILRAACARRFRSSLDVNQWAVLWWQIAGGNFRPREIDNLVLDICEENLCRICDAIRFGRHMAVCLNDPGGNVPAGPVIQAFQEKFPEKCEFER